MKMPPSKPGDDRRIKNLSKERFKENSHCYNFYKNSFSALGRVMKRQFSSKNFVLKSRYFQNSEQNFYEKSSNTLPFDFQDDDPSDLKEIGNKINNDLKDHPFNIIKFLIFHETQLSKMNLEPLIQFIIHKVITVNGCKYYVSEILKKQRFADQILFPLLKSNMLPLINHEVGNYLYQSFIEVLNDENLIELIEFVTSNWEKVFFSYGGTRVVQKLLDLIYSRARIGKIIHQKISEKLLGNVEKMSKSENGNFIIQKYIISVQCEKTNFIFEEIIDSFLPVAKSKFGCFVIQRCLNYGSTEQKRKILDCILKNAIELISDQFGNYVIQCLISLSQDWVISSLFTIIYKDIIHLCKEKYSSIVIEKLLNVTNKALVNDIANIILSSEFIILELVCSQYGNFIIQKILNSITEQRLIDKIMWTVVKNSNKIKKNNFGKRFLLKIAGYYPGITKNIQEL